MDALELISHTSKKTNRVGQGAPRHLNSQALPEKLSSLFSLPHEISSDLIPE